MSSEKKWIVLLLHVAVAFYAPLVLLHNYEWFVTPMFNQLPVVSYGQMWGLAFFWGLFTWKYDKDLDDDDLKEKRVVTTWSFFGFCHLFGSIMSKFIIY